jgi:hypothetical protein
VEHHVVGRMDECSLMADINPGSGFALPAPCRSGMTSLT